MTAPQVLSLRGGQSDCQKIIFASLLENLNFQKSSDFFLLDAKGTPPGFLSPYLPSRSFCCIRVI